MQLVDLPTHQGDLEPTSKARGSQGKNGIVRVGMECIGIKGRFVMPIVGNLALWEDERVLSSVNNKWTHLPKPPPAATSLVAKESQARNASQRRDTIRHLADAGAWISFYLHFLREPAGGSVEKLFLLFWHSDCLLPYGLL